jgi:hypothetical protein
LVIVVVAMFLARRGSSTVGGVAGAREKRDTYACVVGRTREDTIERMESEVVRSGWKSRRYILVPVLVALAWVMVFGMKKKKLATQGPCDEGVGLGRRFVRSSFL